MFSGMAKQSISQKGTVNDEAENLYDSIKCCAAEILSQNKKTIKGIVKKINEH